MKLRPVFCWTRASDIMLVKLEALIFTLAVWLAISGSSPQHQRCKRDVRIDHNAFAEIMSDKRGSLPSSRRSTQSPFTDERSRMFQRYLDHVAAGMIPDYEQKRPDDESLHIALTGIEADGRNTEQDPPRSDFHSPQEIFSTRNYRPITHSEEYENDYPVEDDGYETIYRQGAINPANYRRTFDQRRSEQDYQPSRTRIIPVQSDSDHYYETGPLFYEHLKPHVVEVHYPHETNSKDDGYMHSYVVEHQQQRQQHANIDDSNISLLPGEILNVERGHTGHESIRSDIEGDSEIISFDVEPSEQVYYKPRSSTSKVQSTSTGLSNAAEAEGSSAVDAAEEKFEVDGQSLIDEVVRAILAGVGRSTNPGDTAEKDDEYTDEDAPLLTDEVLAEIESDSVEEEEEVSPLLAEEVLQAILALRTAIAGGTTESPPVDVTAEEIEDENTDEASPSLAEEVLAETESDSVEEEEGAAPSLAEEVLAETESDSEEVEEVASPSLVQKLLRFIG